MSLRFSRISLAPVLKPRPLGGPSGVRVRDGEACVRVGKVIAFWTYLEGRTVVIC